MNDMIYIEKKSVVPIPEVNGAVSDTWNINNKTTNAPSIRLVKEELIPSGIIKNNIYSSEETIVGTWIDGKPIYRKVIDFGALPNNTTKTYDTGDLKIDTFTEPIRGTTESATGFCSGVPFVHIGNNSYGVSINYNKNTNKISVQTGYDRSVQIKTYVILEYTKTTDQ